ncbi:unnamed protein product [Rhizophagus irregularis]|uniref:Uncharacterized protein n=1 Tax=Rhizophagus irregularis TaxID=588596 RepID=A0A916EEM5_9GLOM|nr:unnamed protein product [Rhizophagus irregularis]
MDVYPVNIMNVYPVDITNVYPVDIMNVYPVETNPINVNEVVNDLQNMEDVEYISADKENNNEELISTYTCLLLYIQFTYKLTASIFTAVASEDVPEDIKFDMWEEVDSYFDEYGVRNGFAIIKYRMERNSKGQVHKRTLICEFGGKYKSKKKDEAKLKGTQQNTKTKKLAKSTLCKLADRIDSRLKEEERWNQFHEYKQSTTTNTTSTSGQDLFPIVTKTLNKYLTDPISNTIKTEISQCLFVNAIMIEPNNEELSCEQENPDKASDGFIEDQHDARFITLQTMIEEVGQERVMIPQRWYKDIYQSGLDLQEKIIGVYNNEFTDEGILPAQKPITIPTTIPILRKAVYKRNLYGHVWGLARTATLLAVEQEDDEIATLLQDYIRRKSNREVDESSTASTIAAITESSSPSISTIDERSAINERSIIDNIASITEISNTSHENQINEGDTDAGLNFQNVKNPNKVINKGRPPKRRYMSSVEKSREIPKTRGSYKCRVCNGIGHNAAFHKNTDGWTSSNNISFLSITAHLVTNEWKLKSFLLDFIKFDSPHSGDNIKEVFLKSLRSYNIESKILSVTMDNASNNVTFLQAVENKLSKNFIDFDSPVKSLC